MSIMDMLNKRKLEAGIPVTATPTVRAAAVSQARHEDDLQLFSDMRTDLRALIWYWCRNRNAVPHNTWRQLFSHVVKDAGLERPKLLRQFTARLEAGELSVKGEGVAGDFAHRLFAAELASIAYDANIDSIFLYECMLDYYQIPKGYYKVVFSNKKGT